MAGNPQQLIFTNSNWGEVNKIQVYMWHLSSRSMVKNIYLPQWNGGMTIEGGGIPS
jgi:hypothetical protein